jgi:histidinol-phosphate aminotransferase
MSEFTFSLESVARANILELQPYRCARDDYSEGILLDANENSIGPAIASRKDLQLNRYPDPLHYGLKEEIAKLRGIKKEQIFLGVGSDEAIDILFRIFCNPRADNAVITPPTYGMYKVCAKVNDVAIKSAPLTPSFDLDVESTLQQVDAGTKLLFICSPGNPTAKVIPNAVVEQVLQRYKTGIVVVDEAYIDFSGTESACSLIAKYPNLVVMQTLSKAFGLAGIRLGMAMGNESIIQLMNNIKAPYNINKLTVEVAAEAFADLSLYHKNVQILLEERTFLLTGLASLSVVKKIHHTDANFILFVVPKAQQIYKSMADNGIVCRYRGMEMHCDECLRVTVGTRAENEQFLKLFAETVSKLGVD